MAVLQHVLVEQLDEDLVAAGGDLLLQPAESVGEAERRDRVLAWFGLGLGFWLGLGLGLGVRVRVRVSVMGFRVSVTGSSPYVHAEAARILKVSP